LCLLSFCSVFALLCICSDFYVFLFYSLCLLFICSSLLDCNASYCFANAGDKGREDDLHQGQHEGPAGARWGAAGNGGLGLNLRAAAAAATTLEQKYISCLAFNWHLLTLAAATSAIYFEFGSLRRWTTSISNIIRYLCKLLAFPSSSDNSLLNHSMQGLHQCPWVQKPQDAQSGINS